MSNRPVLPAIITLLSLTACAGSNNNTATVPNDDNTETAKGESVTGYESPCELVSLDDVIKLFAIPEDLDIEHKDRVLTYPTCSFVWKDGKVVKTMQVGSNTMDIEMPSKVMIVMVKDANESMYQTSVKVYKDIESVDNVGDMASWGTAMTQLTFLSHHYLFHVNVKTSNDDVENKARAIELAHLIIGKL